MYNIIQASQNLNGILYYYLTANKTLLDIFEDYPSQLVEQLDKLLPNNSCATVSLSFNAPNGQIIFYDVTLSQLFKSNGKKSFLLVSALIKENEARSISDAEYQILKVLLDSSPGFISITDATGSEQYFSNKNFFNHLGYQYPDNKNIWHYAEDFVHADDLDYVLKIRKTVNTDSKEELDFYFRVIHIDGNIKFIHLKLIPFKKENNKIKRFISIIQDTTDKENTRIKFKEESYIYKSIINHSKAEILIANEQKQLLSYITKGILFETIEETTLDSYFIANQKSELLQDTVNQYFTEALKGEHITTTFKENNTEYNIQIFPIKQNRLLHRLLIVINGIEDISQKQKISELISAQKQDKLEIRKLLHRNTALLQQEKRLSILLDFQKNFIIKYNQDGEITYINKACAQFLKAKQKEIISGYRKPVIHPDDRVIFKSYFEKLHMNPFKSVTFEYRFLVKEIPLWTRWEVTALLDKNKEVVEYIASGIDFTDEKKYEEVVFQSQYRFDLIARATNDAIWDWDINKNTFWCNPAFFKLMGLAESKQPDISKLIKLIHIDDKEKFNDKISTALSEKNSKWSIEFRSWVESKKEYRYFYNRAYLTFDLDNYPERMLGSIMDITERKKNEIKYHSLNESYKLAVKAGKTGVWQYNITEELFTFDKNLLYLYNIKDKGIYEHEDISGIIGKKEFVSFKTALTQYLNKHNYNEPFELIQQRTTNSKRKCWMISRAEIVYDEDGKPLKLVGTDTDITEQKQSEEKRRLAVQKAEEAIRTKENFFSIMSHEIRSPLSGITGMNDLLLQQNPRSDQKRLLSAIKFSADNLLVLINDILDFSKIKAGKLEFEKNDFDLLLLLQNTHLSYETQANDRNLEFSLKIGDKVPRYICGDPTRLSQVLNNLLSNALKFTAFGEVKLMVDVVKESETKITLLFEVKDSGIGIPIKKQKKIFEPFQQATKGTARKYGGTGLGLSIVKNLVKLQKGSISLESKTNDGTTFKVIIEYNKVNQDEIRSKKEKEAGHIRDFRNIKMLYVEDLETNQLIMKGFAARWGIDLETASDGFEGIHKIQENEYDMVLMDVQMPGIDGFETTSRIRSFGHEYYKNVPIIALTADISDEVIRKAKKNGMTDYLSKPVNHEKLYQVIKAHHIKPINHETSKQKVLAIESLSEEKIQNVEMIDFSEPDRLFLEDYESYIDFLQKSEKEFSSNQERMITAILEND
ncbi:MAG: PAS domain-containing protein, partial [Bacteroidota bacterium]